MNRVLLIPISAALWGCPQAKTPITPLDPPQVKALFQARGCTQCHDRGRELVGPSFAAIARRYANDPAGEQRLVKSIVLGSNARWQKPIGMPPQQVTAEESLAMSRWILHEAGH